MATAAEKDLIPKEHFSQKGTSAGNGIMAKTFFCDLSKVMHWPAGLGGCDFGDCYDRAAHPVASLALQSWGVTRESVRVLLTALQTMQFCLRTGFGESKQFYGGNPCAAQVNPYTKVKPMWLY